MCVCEPDQPAIRAMCSFPVRRRLRKTGDGKIYIHHHLTKNLSSVCVWGEWALKSFLGVSPTWKRIIPWYVHYIPRNHWFYTTHSVGWISIYAYIYRVGWTPMSPTWGRSSDKLGYGAPMSIVIKLSIHLNTGTALPSKSHELWLQAP